MDVKIAKKAGTFNEYTVTIKRCSAGKILAIQHALEAYQTASIIGEEALQELKRGMDGCPELIEFLK
jgi:hypothetical protein